MKKEFEAHHLPVVATQDWHPVGHGSFASAHGKEAYSQHTLGGLPQTMWPDHCVQNSRGAEIHSDFTFEHVCFVLHALWPCLSVKVYLAGAHLMPPRAGRGQALTINNRVSSTPHTNAHDCLSLAVFASRTDTHATAFAPHKRTNVRYVCC